MKTHTHIWHFMYTYIYSIIVYYTVVCIILGFGTISCMIAVYGKAGSHQSSAHKYNISQSDHTNNQRLTQKIPLIATLTFVIFCALTSRSKQLGWIFTAIWVQASSGIPMVIYFGDSLWVNTCVGWVNQHSRDHFLTFKGALRHSHLPRPSCEKRTRMGTNSFVSVGENLILIL